MELDIILEKMDIIKKAKSDDITELIPSKEEEKTLVFDAEENLNTINQNFIINISIPKISVFIAFTIA